MKNAIPLRQIIGRIDQLQGELVEVEGVLDCDFDHMSLWSNDDAGGMRPFGQAASNPSLCVELTTGSAALSFDGALLRDWHGRRVSIIGVLHGPGSCGQHGGLAKIEAYAVVLN